MKKFYCLLTIFLFAFPVFLMTGCAGNSGDLNAKSGQGGYTMPKDEFNYQQLWKEVEDFNNQGLPKSALKVVEKIYNAAKDNNNAAEFIKAIIHKLRFLQEVEEETLIKIHTQLTNELKESSFPITPVLHSMLAEQYWNYYRDNRYRFLKRTTTVDFKQDDMRTWTLQKIVEEIVHHYKASLEQREKAKQTKIDIYDKILKSGSTGSRTYRPTLYDFLAHRAIDFFMDNESGLTQPVYRFSLNKDEYFSDAREFAKLDITTRDPLSFHYYALTALQELIRFHLDDNKPDALVDVDLKRLRFIYREAVISNKEIIYEKRLRHMLETYGDVPVAAGIYYELASLYCRLGDKYKPAPSGKSAFEDYKWHKKKAHDLCLEAIKKFPGSTGAHNCTHLVNQIEALRLDISQEKAVSVGKPFPALVQYRNIDKIYLKVVKTDREEIEKKNRLRQKDMVAFYTGKKSVSIWETGVPNDGDFQGHAAEIKVDALEPGEYVLLASNNNNFDFSSHVVAYSFFTVTNIAYVHRQGSESGFEFYLVHRESGRPLAGAEAQTWYREYNRSARAYEMTKGPRYKTDQNGYLTIKNTSSKNYFHLEFINGTDHLYTSRQFYTSRYSHPYTKKNRTFFFTDRGIYRPGQTLYFKGIVLEIDGKDGEKNRILPNYSSTVILYDVNHQKVSELHLTTNEYGTFSGTFQLPVGRLNGNMRIADANGSASFSVEEYKRPKFQVLFEPMEETYKLEDTVTVKGKAAAYAGYNIDNADVKYRVVRTVFYPYRWCFWRYTPPSPQMEILNGVTKTDEKGTFEINFKAIPDLTLSKKNLPAFNYTVYAEVTDINGETQQSTKRVTIGYTALKITADLPEQVDKEKKDTVFRINSTTLSGDFVPAKGEVAIYRLKEADRIFKSKYWSLADNATMDKKDYYKYFPHDSFADEADFVNWEREKQVFKEPFDTAVSKELRLTEMKKWKTGKYVAEMNSKDRYGSPVKEIIYFTLYSPKEKKVPYTQLDWFTIPKGMAEPGEKAVILFGSSSRDVRVIYEMEYRGKIIEKHYFTLQNEQKKIEIPIEMKHRGNIGVYVTFIKHNRIFMHSHSIVVPWFDKRLDITFETFRDKLKPGENEEWRLKIRKKQGVKGEQADKVEAEMLATLYDASLDAFRPLSWSFGIYPSHYNRHQWQNNEHFGSVHSRHIGILQKTSIYSSKYYDQLNWFGFYWREYRLYRSRKLAQEPSAAAPPPQAAQMEADGVHAEMGMLEKKSSEREEPEAEEMPARDLGDKIKGDDTGGGGEADLSQVKARTAFQETAFFYPHLRTGDEGEVIISFTIPESLTKWKMMGFAHTKDLKYGFTSNELVTQKELMVVPNAPRFFREGDTLELTSKITNLSDKELSGTAKLMLFDAATLQPVDAKFKNNEAKKSFTAKKGQSDRVAWAIEIPDDIDTVTYRIVAQSGKFSDGEEQPVPILKNRMLVTETMPLPIRAKQTKQFTFNKLVNSSKSATIKHHKFTLEFTANPVWYAVQALPMLMEYPHECLEQIFSRYYANSIASFIVHSDPKIKRVFDIWKNAEDSNSLLSNLEKNQELKTLLLEETPWVLNAQNETERKKRVALLFDLNKMASQMDRALQKLKEGQMPSGAWPWFHGMSENRYITQHIVCGFAHLNRLNVIDIKKGAASSSQSGKIWAMLKEAVPYLDRKIKEDYDWLIKHEVDLDKMNINYIQVHYLYARSYFKDIPMDDSINKAFSYYKDQAEKYWLNFNKYLQGMIALALNRYNNHQTATAIARSIKEHALYSEEMGMYWKESYGFYWYRMPIETHALLIEMFDEILDDQKSVDEMKTWLLKQKQTQDWRTTKATAEACYALLLKGTDWLAESAPPDITIGKNKPIKIEPQKMDNVKVEAGTGYFKTSWSGSEVIPDMGHITVTNNNKMVAWGGVYWQYFENLDKITPAKTPLQLKKQLFVERPSDTGPKLHPLKKEKVKIGDRVKVRIELRVDRTMEYVHMKDMRASGFEPENVISRYKWQDGLGYYETTKDASTNFFFDYLPKGTYVFEYPLRVSHAGDFSNGITTIQCMYAPEFSSHSEGVRVIIDRK